MTSVPLSPAREARQRLHSVSLLTTTSSNTDSYKTQISSPYVIETSLLPLFMIDVLQPQVFARDEETDSAILFSFDSARIEGLQNTSEIKEDDAIEVDISVSDSRLFVAPTNVDVEKGEMWLPRLKSSDVEGFASLKPKLKKNGSVHHGITADTQGRKFVKKNNSVKNPFKKEKSNVNGGLKLGNKYGLYHPIIEAFDINCMITARPKLKSTAVAIDIPPSLNILISENDCKMVVSVLTSLTTPYSSIRMTEKEKNDKEQALRSVLVTAGDSASTIKKIQEEWYKYQKLSWEIGEVHYLKNLMNKLRNNQPQGGKKDNENGVEEREKEVEERELKMRERENSNSERENIHTQFLFKGLSLSIYIHIYLFISFYFSLFLSIYISIYFYLSYSLYPSYSLSISHSKFLFFQ